MESGQKRRIRHPPCRGARLVLYCLVQQAHRIEGTRNTSFRQTMTVPFLLGRLAMKKMYLWLLAVAIVVGLAVYFTVTCFGPDRARPDDTGRPHPSPGGAGP